MSGELHICSLAAMPGLVARTGAGGLISLINRDMLPSTPPTLRPERHLQLAMNDIQRPLDGLVAPSEEHVRRLIAFVSAWDRKAPLVIHCWAGVSRSSAAAFITLAALRPADDELALARELRAASRTATPNQRLVALGDEILGRDGRMQDAISSIGRGDSALEGAPYVLKC